MDLNKMGITRRMIGKYAIVLGYERGAWIGILENRIKYEVVLRKASVIYRNRFDVPRGFSLDRIAFAGIYDKECRLGPPVDRLSVKAMKILPVSDVALDSIYSLSEFEDENTLNQKELKSEDYR